MDKIPFPQANDFNKIERIMEISTEAHLSDTEFMQAYLDGITDRQVSYYLSAAMYLGLIDSAKRFTELGNQIRSLDSCSRTIEYVRLLLSDHVFGKVYISQKVLGIDLTAEDAGEIIRNYYPDYSEPIYLRRGQTVLSWVGWIESKLNK